MRIVGGEFRGRILAAPRTHTIRPTSDRLREAVFNILSHGYPEALEGARVLDLFAGTGALGLEALSRGARFCTFVDDSAEARGLIRANIDALGLGGRSRLFRRDAARLGDCGANEPFSLAFLDPPYRKGLAERCLDSLSKGKWLSANALVMIEEAADVQLALPPEFILCEQRVYGDTQLILLHHAEASHKC